MCRFNSGPIRIDSGEEATAQGAFSIRSRDETLLLRGETSRCHAAQSMPIHVTSGANPDRLTNSLTDKTSGARSRDRACCCTRASGHVGSACAKQMDGDGLLLLTDWHGLFRECKYCNELKREGVRSGGNACTWRCQRWIRSLPTTE